MPRPYSWKKTSSYTKSAWVDDLLHLVAELLGTVKRLHGFKETDMEIGGFRTVLL